MFSENALIWLAVLIVCALVLCWMRYHRKKNRGPSPYNQLITKNNNVSVGVSFPNHKRGRSGNHTDCDPDIKTGSGGSSGDGGSVFDILGD